MEQNKKNKHSDWCCYDQKECLFQVYDSNSQKVLVTEPLFTFFLLERIDAHTCAGETII